MTDLILIISGPSGVGKDTVIDAWREVNPRVQRVVAATSRSPRAGELDGVDYHFLTESQFRQLAEAEGFLEFEEVHGNLYGTPYSSLHTLRAAGQIPILKIDTKGALRVMKAHPTVVGIMLMPPSEEELLRRITERGTEDPASVARRMENAKAELAAAPHYHHRVTNQNVEETVEKLEQILQETLCRASS
jgi:guanylate kinase